MAKDKQSDKHFMKLALKQARRGLYTTSPNPAVGCVIVRDGKVLGKGYHHQAGQPHAEIMAMRDAEERGNTICGATVYVTLEPCSHYGRTPPCAKALCEALVKRVVIAMGDPNPKVSGRGIAMLEEAGIEVKVGVCEKQAQELNRAFLYSITHKRPWVFVKYGMSLDSKLALSSGESQWITGIDARADVQRLRLWSDVIITSHATVKSDNPRMTVRVRELPEDVRKKLDLDLIRQPRRVVIDSMGSLCAERNLRLLEPYSLFKDGENYIVVGCAESLSLYKDQVIVDKKAAELSKLAALGDAQQVETIPDNPEEILKQQAAAPDDAGATAPEDSAKAKPKRKRTCKSKEDPAKVAALAAALAEAERVTAAELEAEQAVEQEANHAFDKDNSGASSLSTEEATEALDAAKKKRTKKASKKASAAASAAVSAEAKPQEQNAAQKATTATKDAKSTKRASAAKSKSAPSTAAKAVTAATAAKAVAAKSAAKSQKVLLHPDPEAKVLMQGRNYRVEEYTEHVNLVFVPLVRGYDGREHVSLEAVLDFLGAMEVRVAMVEAGPQLGSAFIDQNLINECYCYLSPMILGKGAQDAFTMPQVPSLSESLHFGSMDVSVLGHDVRLILSNLHTGN